MATPFASLSTTTQRITARLSENLSETARDLGLAGLDSASVSQSSARYLDHGSLVTPDGLKEIRRLLESKRESVLLEGLRRVVAIMLTGRPVTAFYPLVINCLSSAPADPQIRSLVATYVLHTAAQDSELALLGVNMYQKDLRDPNPVVRAAAISVLSSMGLESIAALVIMSLKTACRDGSWLVRRSAAVAIQQVYSLDHAHLSSLLPILTALLGDKSALVVPYALAAFQELCPDRIDLLHPHYRRLCRMMVDAADWGQLVMLEVLVRYARLEFTDPNVKGATAPDQDLLLLLKCAEPLLQSSNAAVVTATARAYRSLAPSSMTNKTVQPLLRISHSSAGSEVQDLALHEVYIAVNAHPELFQKYTPEFLLLSSDLQSARLLKLKILQKLANEKNASFLLQEFVQYTGDLDLAVACDALRAIASLASISTKVYKSCLDHVLKFTHDTRDEIVATAILALRNLLTSSDEPSSTQTIVQLALKLMASKISDSNARANLYWLVGQHLQHIIPPSSLDLARYGAKNFVNEPALVKIQILSFMAKLVVLSQKPTAQQILNYTCTLARYDEDYSVRDASRYLVGLVGIADLSSSTDTPDLEQQRKKGGLALVKSVLMDNKCAPAMKETTTPTESGMQAILGHHLQGWKPLPPWSQTTSTHNQRTETISISRTTSPAQRAFSSSDHRENLTPHMPKIPVVLRPTESSGDYRRREQPRDLDSFLQESESESEEEEEEESDEEESEDSGEETSRLTSGS